MNLAGRVMLGIAFGALACAPSGAQEEIVQTSDRLSAPVAQDAFDRLKALVGAWRGQRPDGRDITVSYRLTAGGTVLVETWALGPEREALTLYHMDGADLLATHYCPIGNQPRLRLTKATAERLDFVFQDATDLVPDEPHQHDFWIEFDATGAIARGDTYVQGDESDSETIVFARTHASAE